MREGNWTALSTRRERTGAARCTVTRLMRAMGLQGAVRGKRVRTTIPSPIAPLPLDRVKQQFHAPRPNALWFADFTYIVGWRVSRSAETGFVLVALEQAPHDRSPFRSSGLIRHSDHGARYVSIRYTEQLAEARIEPSVGSVGDSYDNALAETINGLFKAEAIHRRGPWRHVEAVEFPTLEWVDRFNNRRLLEPLGNIPPTEAEHATVNNSTACRW